MNPAPPSLALSWRACFGFDEFFLCVFASQHTYKHTYKHMRARFICIYRMCVSHHFVKAFNKMGGIIKLYSTLAQHHKKKKSILREHLANGFRLFNASTQIFFLLSHKGPHLTALESMVPPASERICQRVRAGVIMIVPGMSATCWTNCTRTEAGQGRPAYVVYVSVGQRNLYAFSMYSCTHRGTSKYCTGMCT